MKRILCVVLCVVMLAAVWTSGQDAKRKSRKQASARDTKAVDDRDPFGASATADRDPFGESDKSARDPFGPSRDPFGGGSAKPTRQSKEPVSKEPVSNERKRGDGQPTLVFRSGNAASLARIERELERETTFDFLDAPLSDVIQDIAFRHNIPIVIDVKALEDFGIDTGTPITRSVKGISLRAALRLMLRDLELTYMIRDEVMQITTPESAEAMMQVRIYPVAEILPENGDGEWLVELVTTVVAPDTWAASGGPGAIVFVDHLETLVVSQTDEVMEEIAELLSRLALLPHN